MWAAYQAAVITQDDLWGEVLAKPCTDFDVVQALPVYREWQEALEVENDLLELCADLVPASMEEARWAFALAAEVGVPGIDALWQKTQRDGRTLEVLIALRQLERQMMEIDDGCVPPRRIEARVLRGLIAFMARPSLV